MLSDVFEVGRKPELTITAGSGVTEGTPASFTITADAAQQLDLTVRLSVADVAGSNFLADTAEGGQTVVLAKNTTSVTYNVATVADSNDEASGDITVTLQGRTGYDVGATSAASVTVTDDDPTTVTLEAVPGDLPENAEKNFSVRLSRALVAGEILPVPIAFGGTASTPELDSADYTLSCVSLPDGVSCADLSRPTITVTFTGGTDASRIADVTIRAVKDTVDEGDGETVTVSLGTLSSTSGTNLGGGATGVDNLADFSILETLGVSIVFSVNGSSKNEGWSDNVNNTTNRYAEFQAIITAGTVGPSGVVIPFTVNSGAAVAGDAQTNDYASTPRTITIAQGDETPDGLPGAVARVLITDDIEDELREAMRFTVTTLPPGYQIQGGGDSTSDRVVIIDDDETEVSLTGGGTITEQDTSTTATVTISTDRPLLTDRFRSPKAESLTVPLALTTSTGAALPGATNPLFAVTASGTGVALTNANTATPTLTFTGADPTSDDYSPVQTATVTFTATNNGDSDITPETVTVALGNITTTMDGGAVATADNSATLIVADNDTLPVLSVAIVETDGSVTEPGSRTIRVRRDGGNDVLSALNFSADAGTATGFSDTFSNVTSIPANQRSVDVTYSVSQDTADVPRGEATYELSTDAAYTISSSMGSVALEVIDNDPTTVALAAGAGNLTEGGEKEMTITLGRGLVSGETLVAPLTFGGTATLGTDYTLSGMSGTGVSYQSLNTSSASVTFTGPDSGETATTATITLSAATDTLEEATPETVAIGLGALTSGAGLDGGASGSGTVSFSIADPSNVAHISVSDSEVTEGDSPVTVTVTLNNNNTSGSAITIPIQVDDTVDTSAQQSDYMLATSISIPNNAKVGTTLLMITDDAVTEDDEIVLIQLGAGLPLDVRPGTDNVGISISDDDTPALVFSATSLTVAEGSSGSYTVKLASEPTGTVTVTVGGASGEVTVDTDSGTNGNQNTLTFTTSNWNTAQPVTVAAGEDADTANDSATLSHTAAGGGYNSVTGNVAVTVTDNDTAGLVFSPTSLTVAEGSSGSYTVKLASEPTGTVTVTVGGASGEVTVDTDSGTNGNQTTLTFSSSNWSTAQPVTVAAGEDVDTTNDSATLSHTATGGGYNSVTGNVAVTVTDNDTAGLVFSATSLTVAEGSSGSYTVRLASEPTGTVTVTVGGASGEVTVDTDSGTNGNQTTLTFSSSNWSTAQPVTVAAGEDVDTTNDSATLSHTATGGGYNSVTGNVAVTVTDNDTAGLVFSATSLTVAEGSSGSYTVRLASEPTGTVTVTVGGASGEVTVDTDSGTNGNQTTLTFSSSNWSTAQPVTVAAGEDVDTTNDSATLSHTATGGGYNSVTGNVAVTVTDNDTAATEVGVTGGGAITEGAAARFTLTATPAPATGNSIDVAVTISDSGSFASTGQTGSRTITINDSGTARFTVGTEDDNIQEEDGSITVVVQGGTGYDPHSTNASASVTVEDNDDPAVMVSPDSLTITEGGSASYTVALNVEPTDTVTVTVSGMAGTGLTLDKTSLTFTTATWNTAQTVTVTAGEANDTANDTVTLTHVAAGGGYTGAASAVVTVTVVAVDSWVLNGWHLRFGRTVSQQVLDALQDRFTTPSRTGMALTVAGEEVTGATPLEENEEVLSKLLGFETVSTEELVQDSSFTFTPAAEAAAPQPAFWGAGALSSFSGQEDTLSLNGRVMTALLGADWSTERWRAGVALSHSRGSGAHEAEEGANHDVSSSMTGLFPYGRYALSPRLGIWAVAGYGWGRLLLKPHGNAAEAVEAPSNLRMGAVGMDGLLLDGGDESITLSTTADLLLVGATSAAVDGLAASEEGLSRLRLGLEAVRPFPLSNGAVLTPSMELGVRVDQGDAETGYGMDLGGGVLWRDPERGISSAVQGRTLLVHGEKEFRDQGLSLSFSWDASPSNRGPSLSLSHVVGASTSEGMAALLDPVAIETLDGPGSNGWKQFEAELAYGFPVDNDRLTLAPAVALTLSPESRSYGLLWSLAPYSEQGWGGTPWEITLEGEREEQVSSASPPEHSLKLLFSLLF